MPAGALRATEPDVFLDDGSGVIVFTDQIAELVVDEYRFVIDGT